MFEFKKLSNIIRIRFTVKISFKMPKQGRQTNKENPPIIVYLSVVFLACYFPFFPCTILYMTNTTEISFLVAQFASEFLLFLNSSLNALVYCWRYWDSPNCKKHTEENNSPEREYDIRGKDLNFRIVLTKNVMQSFFETELSEKMQRTCYATKTKETCERERLAYSTSELVLLERETKRHRWS